MDKMISFAKEGYAWRKIGHTRSLRVEKIMRIWVWSRMKLLKRLCICVLNQCVGLGLGAL